MKYKKKNIPEGPRHVKRHVLGPFLSIVCPHRPSYTLTAHCLSISLVVPRVICHDVAAVASTSIIVVFYSQIVTKNVISEETSNEKKE
jgi:hypothetical protein